MRVVQTPQMQIGEVDISGITFDLRCRDDIPKILRGLQHIYTDLPLREDLFHRGGKPGAVSPAPTFWPEIAIREAEGSACSTTRCVKSSP